MTKKLYKRKQLLIDTLSVQTSSGKEEQMIQYIINFCIKNVPSAKIQVDNNNIYVTKGNSDIYPCIVAHTDTVHEIHKHFKVYDDDNCLFAFNAESGTQVGVGGDDKGRCVASTTNVIITRHYQVCFLSLRRNRLHR